MREFIVGESEADARFDKFLKKLLPGAPLSLIYKLSRTNRAKVDGKKRENDYRLELGQTIKLFLSEEEFAEFGRQSAGNAGFSADGESFGGRTRQGGAGMKNDAPRTKFTLTKDRILFEDDFVLAVNKPAGLNVHPGDHKSDENSLIEAVTDYYAGNLDTLTFRPSLVHRIDRDTS